MGEWLMGVVVGLVWATAAIVAIADQERGGVLWPLGVFLGIVLWPIVWLVKDTRKRRQE